MKKLIIRLLSGSVYVALIVISVLLLPIIPSIFAYVFGVFLIIGFHELYHMRSEQAGDKPSKLLWLLDSAGAVDAARGCGVPALFGLCDGARSGHALHA